MSRNHSLDHTVIERNRRARDEFLTGASPGPFIIDPAIVRAWQRCVRIGVEPERPVEFKAVHANDRRAAIDANQPLVEAAGDELDRLGRAMVPSGASVILADMSLVTIGVRGRAAAMSREMQVACREGVDLSESSIGSNALTIAAIEQSPSIVLNNAHFCSMNAIFACAAAPIRSPVGTLLGVVDVTTCHQPLPAEAPFLVNASARAIENAIFARDTDRMVVRFHPRADLLGTPMEAAILCSPDGDIVGANEAALGLLGLRWPLRGAHFSRSFRLAFADLLARAGRREFAALTLVSASGVPLHAQVAMPMRQGGRGRVLAIGARPGFPAAVPPGFEAAAGADADPIGRFAAADDALRLQLRRGVQGLAAGVPVLVQGESGTGKLAAARALHEAGFPAGSQASWQDVSRAGSQASPFVVIDCASLEDGRFEERLAACAGGTCVLDEVSDLPEGLQARLLRLLQQREAIRSAGAPAALEGSVAVGPFRLISTSHRDLHRCCEAGRFRYDLYYRLKGLRVELPPLRHRADRRALIVGALRRARLLRKGAEEAQGRERTPGGQGAEPAQGVEGANGAQWAQGTQGSQGVCRDEVADPPLDGRALDRLLGHRWPGNFRELEWLATLLAATVPPGRTIMAADLPADIGPADRLQEPGPGPAIGPDIPPDLRGRGGPAAGGEADEVGRLRDLQHRAITRAIDKHRGNLSQAARELGVSRGTLYRRLKAVGGGERG